jgi:hypothetical protein
MGAGEAFSPISATIPLNRRLNFMRKLSTFALALAFAAGSAGLVLADDKPTDDEAAKIKAAVEEWGCSGGEYEKESEGTGVYEAEDVKCKAGQYDFRLDKNFKVFAIIAD